MPPSIPPVTQAYPLSSSPTLDGDVINDPVWAGAKATTGFWQINPFEGQPATQRTEVFVGFTEEALYIGAILYDDDPAGITGAYHTLHAAQVVRTQRTIWLERRIDRPLITWHPTLQTERERIHPLRRVLGDLGNEAIRVRPGVEVRPPPIFESRIHHADIHQQTFSCRARVRRLAIDEPAITVEGDAGCRRCCAHQRQQAGANN